MNTPEALQAFQATVSSPDYRHCRAKSWRASGAVQSDDDYIVRAYVADTEFGGVVMRASLNGLDDAVAILDRLGKPFPLSPTERD